MQIKKLYIENFGKLHSFKMEFNEGFNAIIQDNGFGKTTLAHFIASMFYGLESSKKIDLNNNIRKKYSPWNSENFGGNLTFSINDKTYTIERFFKNKQSDDTFNLIDNKTNLKSLDFDENIGEELFGVDYDTFVRTIFFEQNGLKVEKNERVDQMLKQSIEGTNEKVNLESILESLKEEAKTLRNNQNRGVIPTLKNESEKLEQQINECNINKERYNKNLEDLKEIENELNLYNENLKNIKSKILVLEKNDNQKLIEDLNSQLKERQKELKDNDSCILKDNVNNFYNAKKLDSDIFSNTYKLDSLKEDYTKKLKNIDENIKNNQNNDKIDEIIKKNEKLKDKSYYKSNKNNLKLYILSSLIGIIGILFIFVNFYYSLPFLVLCLGIITIVIVNEIKNKKYCQSNILRYKQEIENFIKSYNLDYKNVDFSLALIKNKIEDYKKISLDLKNEKLNIDNLEKLINDDQKTFDEFVESFVIDENENMTNSSKISQISMIIDKKNTITNEINSLKNRIKSYSLSEDNENALMKLNYNEKEIESKIDDLKAQRLKLKLENDNFSNNFDLVGDLALQKTDIDKKIKDSEFNLFCLEKTQDILDRANQNLSSSYLLPMKKNVVDILSSIDNKDFNNLIIDTKLNLSFSELGENRDIDYYSQGYKDLVYIAIRLSLIKMLFKEKPIIILDDPFTDFDDGKTNRALKFLNDLSQGKDSGYQIIYLTCSQSRMK
jgi:uncharacterized protein YhaN